MLRRFLIILVESVVICILIAVICLFWASFYVDTGEFRSQFTQELETLVGRPVILDGELDIVLYPSLSLRIQDLSMADSPVFGSDPLVHFDSVQVSIRLLPLLSKQIEVESIVVEGMKINVIRSSKGLCNWQFAFDSQRSDDQSNIPGRFAFDNISLSELEIIRASVVYQDDKDGQQFSLNGINLRTGTILVGEPFPLIVSSDFSWNSGLVKSELVFKGMINLPVAGDHFAIQDATVSATVGGDFLPEGVDPGEMTARVVMDWEKKTIALADLSARLMDLRAEGSLQSGDLEQDIAASGQITLHPFKPVQLVKRFAPTAPVSSVDGLKSGAFTSFFKIDASGFAFSNMAISLDDLTVRGDIKVQDYEHPFCQFDLRGGAVNLDRYLPLFKTDTPFLWSDFPLDFLQKFKGAGSVQAGSFKCFDYDISDIRLSVQTDGKKIALDTEGMKKGQGALAGHAEFILGKDKSTQWPTLGLKAELSAESLEDGFTFLNITPVGLTGVGILKLKVRVPVIPCHPQERSMGILRNVTSEMLLSLGKGMGSYAKNETSKVSLAYSDAALSINATPRGGGKGDSYGFMIKADVRGHGGKRFDSLMLALQGPLNFSVDIPNIASPGVDLTANISGPLYSSLLNKCEVTGKMGFDSADHTLSLSDATIKSLDSTLRGNIFATALNKSFKAFGKINLSSVNPRRIVYLINKKIFSMKDPAAFSSVSAKGNFSLDESGFTISELNGFFDDMPFSGHVVGQGFVDPMLAFSCSAGAFDLDRYLPPSVELTVEERRAGKVYKAPPVELPLGFLRRLRFNGRAVFQQFKLAKIKVQAVSGNLKADMGHIHLSDITGQIYTGKFNADWSGTIGDKILSTQLKLHVDDMQAGSLLTDLAEREYIKGETDVDFDLTSLGATDDDILKNLAGKAWVRIRNGSFKFSGYNVKSEMKSTSNGMGKVDAPKMRRTVFQKAMSYFTVNNGIFTADKFRVEAPPLLQSYGEGSFNLPGDSINLSIRNDFVAVPSVTINIVGKLSDPEVIIPKGKIVNDTVLNILSLPEKSFNFLRDLFR